MQEMLWRPTAAFISQSNLTAFEHWLTTEKGLHVENYAALWKWSTDEVAVFWGYVWEYFNIIAHAPYTSVLSGPEMPGARWFTGAKLNYAEHIFRHKNEGTALVFRSERHPTTFISWKELEQQVVAVRQYLVEQGVGKGDCVVGYLPNIPEAMIAFLAVNSLGAIWSCCSPDFGVSTVLERFVQIHPKVLIASDGYQYGGKAYGRMAEIQALQAGIESLQHTVLIPYLNPDSEIPHADNWEELLNAPSSSEPLTFTPVAFDHPIWVLYSSGTTGKPKAITHSHGGVLLEHLKYHAFHNDVHAGEHFFWFTTTGWMMWNFLQASMLMGAIPVLYDGSPGYPTMNVLWELAAELPLHHFGTSAPFLTACMKRGLQPGALYDLSALRSLGSTGAPLPPEAFDWVYQAISSDLWVCSMSGGTDVCTAFVGGCPSEPVYRGAIQCRTLGCAMKAYDEMGKEVMGSLGEMVIEQPMPSMPIYFWNDPGNKRYRSSYFEEYPGKWRHGDWIHIYENGSLVIQGRSDATLNRKGIRIGTAEIYAILDQIPALQDSMVLNLEKATGGDIMPLFVVLGEGEILTEELKKMIQSELRMKGSPRHVPDVIWEVPDIPYTLSGKKMEVPVKKVLLGMGANKVLNKDAVRNPEAMEYFIDFAEGFRRENL